MTWALSFLASTADAREVPVYENEPRVSRPGSFSATIRTPGDDDVCDYRVFKPSVRACAGIDIAARQKALVDSVQGGGFEWLSAVDVITESGPVSVSAIRSDFDTSAKIERADIDEMIREITVELATDFGQTITRGDVRVVEAPNPAGTVDIEGGSGDSAEFVRAHVVFGEGSVFSLIFRGPRAARAVTQTIADGTIATIAVAAPEPTEPSDPATPWYHWLILSGPLALIAGFRRRLPILARPELPRPPPGIDPHMPSPDADTIREAKTKRRRARRAKGDAPEH